MKVTSWLALLKRYNEKHFLFKPVPQELGTNLQRRESIVFQKWEADDWHQQELDAEGVVFRVVAVPEAHVDQIDSGIGHGQEHNLKAELWKLLGFADKL